MDLDEFRRSLDEWLDAARARPERRPGGRRTPSTTRWPTSPTVKRLAYDAGLMRWGWPERVGGLGGSTLLRAYLGEALTARDLVEPGIYSMTEVLAPTMIDYAAPALAADHGAARCSGATRPGARASRSPAPAATWPRCRAGPTRDGRRLAASRARRCGRASPSTPTAACCSPGPATAESAHRGHHRAVRGHGQPGHRGPADRDDARRPGVLARCSSTTSSCRSTAPWARRDRAGRWPWTCCRTSGAPRCGTGPPSCTGDCRSLLAGRAARRRSTRPTWARSRSCSTRCGPARGPPSTGWPPASSSVPRPPSTRCWWPPPSRRCSTWWPTAWPPSVDRRRRPGQRTVAPRVPVLAGGDDLRRDGGDPAQHHRPPAARPRERSLMDAEDRDALRAQPAPRRRGAHRRAPRRRPRELGWADALVADAQDGRLPPLRARRAPSHATSSALGPGARLLASGSTCPRRRAYVLPPLGRRSPPGTLVDGAPGRSTASAPPACRRPRGHRRGGAGGAHRGRPRSCPTADLTVRRGARPGPRARAGRGARRPCPGRRCGPRWRRRPGPGAVALAQLGPGPQLVGAARAMLELARRHALERVQFGRPIGRFQAVRHRLAETLVAIESAEAVLGAAWEDGSPTTAADRQGTGRARGPDGGPPLPTGPGRHRLHDRARVPPLRPARPGARRAVRLARAR